MALNMLRMLLLCRERSGGAFPHPKPKGSDRVPSTAMPVFLGAGIARVIIEEEDGPRLDILKEKEDCRMQQIRTVSIGEVQIFLQNHPEGFLIDVLPPEFHVRRHIPGSSGVCVFETAFQEKMRALVPDMDAPLLLYGAGGSWDSAVAAEKLQREGYRDISCLPGA